MGNDLDLLGELLQKSLPLIKKVSFFQIRKTRNEKKALIQNHELCFTFLFLIKELNIKPENVGASFNAGVRFLRP